MDDSSDDDYEVEEDNNSANDQTLSTVAQSEQQLEASIRNGRKRSHSPASTASNVKSRETPKVHTPFYLNPDERYVDWDRLASSWCGKEHLTRYLPVLEIDILVGWATNLETFHRPCQNDRRNPLMGLPNIPPRPTLIKHMIHDPSTKIVVGAKEKRLYESFHHSAAVAVGILAEEMMTATLLPLAQRHVKRCRQLESKITDVVIHSTSTEADHELARVVQRARDHVFQEWTLPPEEAIVNLLFPVPTTTPATDDPWCREGLARARPPTKSSVPGALGTSFLLNMPEPGARERIAFSVWCRSHQLDSKFVQDNMDLFGVLLPPSDK